MNADGLPSDWSAIQSHPAAIGVAGSEDGRVGGNKRHLLIAALALTAIAIVGLFCIVGMSVWLGERASVLLRETTDARLIRAAATEMRSALQAAESSQRGYIATGNQIYLAPYGVARAAAERQLLDLKRLLVGRPASTEITERLSSIASAKFAEMDDSIEHKRDRRDGEALALLRSNRGKALMDQANVFLSGIVRDADDRLEQGLIAQTGNSNFLRLVNVLSVLVIVVVAASIAWLVRRYTGELEDARRQLSAYNSTLEKRVAQRTTDLARINEEVRRFAYIVTHDLRAPLVNIIGFTGEVQKGTEAIDRFLANREQALTSGSDAREAMVALREDIPEAIGFIRASAQKMDGLINAILRLSRDGSRPLRLERLQLRQVIEENVALVRHRLTNIGGEASIDSGETAIVSDRAALDQIVANLLDNAVKYASPQRPLSIVIRVVSVRDAVRIDVQDNGRGIAAGDHERVFELFRRVAVDQPGEGIGLAHVRILARALGGDITLKSTAGEGSTFMLTLPLEPRGTRS